MAPSAWKASPPLALSYANALCLLVASQVAGAAYLHALAPHLRPGLSRLLAALPVLAANLAAPHLFSRDADTTTMLLVVFNTAWLSSFKALLWACNRSELAQRRLTATQFAALLLAPLTPASEAPGGRLHDVADPPGVMFAEFAAKMCLLGCIVAVLVNGWRLPFMLVSFLYGLALYCLLSSIMDGPGAIISGWLGIRVSPHFDNPWFSTSVASFWSRRWDLSAGNALRQLVFDSIVEGRLVRPEGPEAGLQAPAATEGTSAGGKEGGRVHKSSPGAEPGTQEALAPPAAATHRLLGTFASFLTSGLVHECIMRYLTGRFIAGGRHVAFFLLQVPVIVAERGVLGALRRQGVEVPRPLLTAYVVAFIVWSAGVLFWPPALEGGVVHRILSNVQGAYRALLERGGAMPAASHLWQLFFSR